jgi:pyruvate dehydrogenase phosphatase
MGSCALIAVVSGNKCFVANAGDCKAVMLSADESGKMQAKSISTTFSANKKYEQERLKKSFPGEKDIFICKSAKACYVKGGLMPSRAFGDLRLKMKQFNFHNFPPNVDYRRPIPQFTGPYIDHRPEIKTFEITSSDKFLVLASDGLWDEIKRRESA